MKTYTTNGKECLVLEPKIKIVGRNKNGRFLIEYHDGTQCLESKENILRLYSPIKEKVEVECSECEGKGIQPLHKVGGGKFDCQECKGIGKTTRAVKRLELKQAIDIGIRQCNLSHEEIYSNYLDTNDKWLIVAYLEEKQNERKNSKAN